MQIQFLAKSIQYLFLLIFIFCLALPSYAQQPAHFFMGLDVFKGLQVYDVIQDKQLNYWFATNEGIFHYDYNAYSKVDCSDAKSSSVFNFVINKNGSIYCHNLNNQIFELRDKECHLFYELGKEEGRPEISLSISDNDELVVGANNLLVIDKGGNLLKRHVFPGHFIGQAYSCLDRSLQFHLNACDSVIKYSNHHFTKHKLNFKPNLSEENMLLKFFTVNENSFAIDQNTKTVFAYEPEKFVLTLLDKNLLADKSQSYRIYETGGEVWLAGTLPGVYMFDMAGDNNPADKLFRKYFISDVYKDSEGNYLLSTFDNGVLVAPDLKIPDVIDAFDEDPVTSLYGDKEIGIILGTSTGRLMNYQNSEFHKLNENGNRPIEAIYGDVRSDLVIFDDGKIRAYNKKTKKAHVIFLASLKDVAIVSNAIIYLGTNRGVIKIERKAGDQFDFAKVEGMNARVYSMEFDSITKCLYVSTSNGLFQLDLFGNSSILEFKKRDVFPMFTYVNKQILYTGLSSGEILVFENKKVTKIISPLVEGKPVLLNKIIIYKNTIIAKSSRGLFQFNMQGKLLRSLNVDFGFSSKKVMDFAIQNGKVWVSHTGGVQEIDLNYLRTNKVIPALRFNSIFVNDKPLGNQKTLNFRYDQRKFSFTFVSPTLKNRENIQYFYKLSGYEKNWNIGSFGANTITYNALAPGTYYLMVKAANHGAFTKKLIYTFTIAKPFYFHWWFIGLCALIFMSVVWVIYRYQLRIQQKKSKLINELNASKLTAIQSQMNPHFIFNSLNSIQDLVLKGDVDNSYTFITKFSDLIRRTLNYSDKDFIDFEQEIKLLELYLSLEKLRFKSDLLYTINTNGIEDVLVPPMLIQPFIENALLHGLLHQEGRKELTIDFKLKDNLICIIQDNGIGREKSREIKLRKGSRHESFSSEAIKKRFAILSQHFGGVLGVKYEDVLVNEKVSGTKVVLTIPVKHKF